MIFKPVLIAKILDGEKTVTRRPAKFDAPCRYEAGKTYSIQPGMARPSVARIKVLSVERQPIHRIHEMGEGQREGFKDSGAFVDYWIGLYGAYTDTLPVWRIEFGLVEQVASVCHCCEGKGVLPYVG